MRARVASIAVVLALGLSLAGCPQPEPEPDPEPSETLRLEVGSGQQFTPLADGDTLLLQRGCQGTQHTFVSLRAWGLSKPSAMVDLALTRVGDGKKLSFQYRVKLSFTPGSGAEDPAELPGLLLAIPDPDASVGKTVRLTAKIDSDSGEFATDSRTGTLEWGPDACP
jgi:hypothetical protein